MRNLLVALVVAALPAVAAAQAQPAPEEHAPHAEPSEAAVAFAGAFAGEHLSGMLSRIGAQNEALRLLAEFDGQTVATVFNAQIEEAVRQHGDAWARKLAIAWSPLLTEAEMRSLAEQGADSPHADKYLAGREAAAVNMAELSQELFGQILQEVLAGTVKILAPEAPAK